MSNNKCDKGYQGDCCCLCEYQLKIHVCGCGKCSKVEGYICIVRYDDQYEYSCTYKTNQHGCCELFRRKKVI